MNSDDIVSMIENDEIIIPGIGYTYTEDDNLNKFAFPTKPDGEYKYMIEWFSGCVSPDDDERYRGWFSEGDYSGDYVRDVMKKIENTTDIQHYIEDKYGDNVEVVFLDFNKGCQYGCALNIWIYK